MYIKNYKKIFNIILLILFLISFQNNNAQIATDNINFDTDVSRRGAAAGTMLGIGVGARAEALGGAFVAIADDPSALHWNPAGIIQIPSLSIQATSTKWFVDTDFNTFDIVMPMQNLGSAIGFHLAMLDYGENPVRTVKRPEGTGEKYSAFDFVASLYWTIGITDRVSTSVGVKYFSQTIWHVSGSTIALDLSLLFKTPVKGLTLGGSLSNFGTEFNLTGRDLTTIMDVDGRLPIDLNRLNVPVSIETETYPLPLLFRFGIAYKYQIDERNSITVASNLNHPSNNKESIDLGIEVEVFNSFYLRSGYQSLGLESAENGLTLGCGISYKFFDFSRVTFDYSWSEWGVLGAINRFTIGLSAM